MCGVCKFFDIENGQCRIGDRFTEYGFGIRTKSGVELFLGAIGRDEGEFYSHTFHGDGKKIIGTSINYEEDETI